MSTAENTVAPDTVPEVAATPIETTSRKVAIIGKAPSSVALAPYGGIELYE